MICELFCVPWFLLLQNDDWLPIRRLGSSAKLLISYRHPRGRYRLSHRGIFGGRGHGVVIDRADLQIHLLGDLKLLSRGRALVLPPSKKTRALLAFLVATDRPHLRQSLCDLLWEGPDDPRGALRWSLAKLRPLLDGEHTTRLVTDRERVAFASDQADVDVMRLSALSSGGIAKATTGELEDAANLFAGEFAEGLDLPACFRFHEWCAAEREKWAALRLAILTTLVERLSDTPEQALVYARRRIGIDPLDENGHIAVIRLLVTLGRQRDALRHYDYCRRVLQAELGVAPSAAIEHALATVKPPGPTRPVGPPLPTSVHVPLHAGETALVGRDSECSKLDEIAAGAAASNARPILVLLTGDPGIGKTRLLRYLDRSITRAGGEILQGRAYEAEMRRPYGIWADMLKGLGNRAIPAAVRAKLQPLLFDSGDTTTPHEGDRIQLFEAVVSLLTQLSSRVPIAVLLDDLQWVDESSVSLLHYVIRAFDKPCRIVFAATARSSELSDNEPAQRLVSSIARERRLQQIPLGPLDERAGAVLAKSMAPGHDVTPVVAASEGNPFFTLELARALANGQNAMPESIEGVLAEHLSRPEGPARTLLPWASALGREFDIGVLTRCVKLSPGEWDDALAELERYGIIRCIGEARYDFSHDLVRSAAYRRISQPRRRLIHSQIAQAFAAQIEANEGGHTLPNELIRHAELGGHHALAARGCILVGEHSMRLFANDEAVDVAERGMRHLGRTEPGPDRTQLQISLLRIQILASSGNRLGRWPSLLVELSKALAAAEACGLSADAATGYFLLSLLHQDGDDDAEAQATTLRAAEVGRNADAITATAQLANTARCLIELELDVNRSRALIAEVGATLGRTRSKTVELLWGEALLERWDGMLDASAALMEEAVELARDEEDRWREVKCLTWLAVINFERAEPRATLANCEELRPLTLRMGEGGEPPFVLAMEALAHLALRHPNATRDLEVAVEQLRAFDSKARLAYVLNAAAGIAFENGNFTAARRAAEDALVAAEATRRVCESVIARAWLARVLGAEGDSSGAARWFGPMLALVGEHGLVGQHDDLSARARSAGLLAIEAQELRIPTLGHTLS
jgi:DNA-binding SARP family transcriptional activator/predicted ATPase